MGKFPVKYFVLVICKNSLVKLAKSKKPQDKKGAQNGGHCHKTHCHLSGCSDCVTGNKTFDI